MHCSRSAVMKNLATRDVVDEDDDGSESRLVLLQNQPFHPMATHSVSPLSGAKSSVLVAEATPSFAILYCSVSSVQD